MTRPVCLQVYISRELSARIRKAARKSDLSVSAWAMSRLDAACDDEGSVSGKGIPIERLARQGVFAMVGIDALLAGHPDPNLRERAHQAYMRKCRELGFIPPSKQEGDP